MNGSATGDIEFTGDRDWFAAALVAGQTYLIENKGSQTGHGTLTDTSLTGMRDSDGRVIALTSDRDSGVGRNAKVYFTPTVSGTHYVEATAHKRVDWDSPAVGRGAKGIYTVAVSEYQSPENDEYPAFITTTREIEPGGSAIGNIEEVGDHDWFAVTLDGNKKYEFNLEGARQTARALTLGYGKIHGFYDSDGNPAAGSVSRQNAGRITFRPDQDGTYHVSVKGDDVRIVGNNQEDYDAYHDDNPPGESYQATIGTYRILLAERGG